MTNAEFYILDNPHQGSVHNLTIPTDSIVYVGYRADSFPNISLPFPTLDWDGIDASKGQIWFNCGVAYDSTGVQIIYSYGLTKPDWTTTFVAFRLYTGCEPFNKAITIVANGYSRTGSGTVTRKIFERENGERYMIDTCPNQSGEEVSCLQTISNSADSPFVRGLSVTGNKIWRDANGTIIGGSMCQIFQRTTMVKVGGRIRNVAQYIDVPETLFGEHPEDGTQVGEDATVEATDGLWEHATPITFTLNLNVVEKSYSYIQI